MKTWNGEQECRGQTSAFYMHNDSAMLGRGKKEGHT